MLGDLYDPHDLPSADDPSLSLEESFDRLTVAVERITAQMDHIRQVLGTFYLSDVSLSTLAPVLELCEQLDPTLRNRRLAGRIEDAILSEIPF
jgi:hypothetical protein